jgi:hypothetical protein
MLSRLFETGQQDIQREYGAAQQDQARAQALGTQIRGDFDRVGAGLDREQSIVNQLYSRLMQRGDDVESRAWMVPDQVREDFEGRIERFQNLLKQDISDLRGDKMDALADLSEGMDRAISSVVEGTQGTINATISQIEGDMNLTPAQKQQMKSQAKFQGSNQIGNQINSTIAGFSQLKSETAKGFTAIIGQTMQAGLAKRGEMEMVGGQAYASSSQVAAQISAEVMKMHEQATNSRNTASAQLHGLRTQATNMQDSLLLQLLPEEGTPYYGEYTLFSNNYDQMMDVVRLDASDDLAREGYDIMREQGQYAQVMGFFQMLTGLLNPLG